MSEKPDILFIYVDDKENAVGLFSEELIKEWEFYEKEEKNRARQVDENTKNKFQAFFGLHFTPDSINNDVVEIDGKRLRYHSYPIQRDTWRVWGICPKCNENTWSKPMGNKRSVAAMIYGNFESDEKHVCNPESVGDRLVLLIRSIVQEENGKS